jgi:hypothetical protein
LKKATHPKRWRAKEPAYVLFRDTAAVLPGGFITSAGVEIQAAGFNT